MNYEIRDTDTFTVKIFGPHHLLASRKIREHVTKNNMKHTTQTVVTVCSCVVNKNVNSSKILFHPLKSFLNVFFICNIAFQCIERPWC